MGNLRVSKSFPGVAFVRVISLDRDQNLNEHSIIRLEDNFAKLIML